MTENEQGKVFQRWLDEYQSMIFKVVRAYAFSELDENDLFQEICIQVWRSVLVFKKKSSVSTWIYRIALNTAIKWERDHQKYNVGKDQFDHSRHTITQPETRTDDRLEWIYSELKKMDRIDRSICLLLLDGFSYAEISGITGITESNVGVKIHRIKKHLKEKSKTYNPNGI
jgi:RNA polymerase sigma-70 factor, ECF subfamily